MALLLGRPVYTEDVTPADCLVVKVLRSPHANAIVQSQLRQVQSLRRAVEIARLQYDNGYTDYLTVLDAERQLFSAELQLAAALRDRLNAVVSVCMALGGGWADPGKSPSFPVVNTERLLQEETGVGKTAPAAAPASNGN